jgi:hypothetical protein
MSLYFNRLATKWRGWTGDEVWRAHEGTLTITATHDGLGHVTLFTTLLSEIAGLWTLEGLVMVNAGQLDEIARHVASYWQP